jgi:hypothetical protein
MKLPPLLLTQEAFLSGVGREPVPLEAYSSPFPTKARLGRRGGGPMGKAIPSNLPHRWFCESTRTGAFLWLRVVVVVGTGMGRDEMQSVDTFLE